jgi:hypothetical protein
MMSNTVYSYNYVLLAIAALALQQMGGGHHAPLFFCSAQEEVVVPNRNLTSKFCRRHLEVDMGNRTIPNALEGLEIRPAFFAYQVPNGVLSQTDIAIQFLDAIAERAGFTWRRSSYGVLDTPDDSDDNDTNTYNSALYTAVEEYDLMGEWYTRTIDRLADSIIYPEGFYDASFIMVALKRDSAQENAIQGSLYNNLWSFMRPFTPEVWGMLVVTMVVSSLTFYLIMRLEKTGVGFGDSMFISIFSFTGHFHYNPRKVRILFCYGIRLQYKPTCRVPGFEKIIARLIIF